MRASRYSVTFGRPGARPIEVHWAFTNQDVAFPVHLDELAGRLVDVDLGGHAVPSFAAGDLLLLLSVHGAKHRWDRLEWVGTFAEVVRSLDDAEIDDAARKARDLGSRRTVLLALELARIYGDQALTPMTRGLIEEDLQVTGLAREASQLLSNEHLTSESALGSKSLSHDLFHYRLREGIRDRLRFLVYRSTTPSRPEEWRTVKLWGRVVPLHPLIRPLQLITRMIPAIYWLIKERTGSAARASESTKRP
jgi:hypothetical protein